MTTMLLIGLGVFLFSAVMLAIKTGLLGAAWHWALTQVGYASDGIKGHDPAGQMLQAAKNAMRNLDEADKALELCDQSRASTQRQKEDNEREIALLERDIKGRLTRGESETSPLIIQKAKSLRSLREALAQNEEDLIEFEATYASLLQEANIAALQIQQDMQEAKRLKVQLTNDSAAVKLQQQLSKYTSGGVVGSRAKIDEYREAALSKRDEHRAKLRVIRDRTAASHHAPEVTEDVSDILASLRPVMHTPHSHPSSNPKSE